MNVNLFSKYLKHDKCHKNCTEKFDNNRFYEACVPTEVPESGKAQTISSESILNRTVPVHSSAVGKQAIGFFVYLQPGSAMIGAKPVCCHRYQLTISAAAIGFLIGD